MGAGIATILTYILRENEKLSSSTCIAFGPGTTLKSIVYFEQRKLRKKNKHYIYFRKQYPSLKRNIGMLPQSVADPKGGQSGPWPPLNFIHSFMPNDY
jgi:hypothetical protein